MSAEKKPVITSLTKSTWNSEKSYKLKPAVSSSISQASAIPELISYLKSAFHDKEFSLVEGILMDREKQLRTEIENLKRDFDSLKTRRNLADKDQGLIDLEKLNKDNQDMQRKCEELKNEKAEVEAKLKTYEEKFEDLYRRISLLEQETAKTHAVDVSVIQKMAEDLEAEDVIDLNGQASGADGDPREKQLSPMAPSVDSTGNGSGKSGDEGIMLICVFLIFLLQLKCICVGFSFRLQTYSNWVIVSVLCLSFTYLSMHVVCWVVELSIYVELEMW
ncbi:hypothetical protein HAX54_040902 [Datura stramonium]|uniref:Uncharacterized protein n=1 Tax=Datura stramonium TaxID=4076 RepID=A0ABS8SKW1_DATST|nr:hypothetical protein [Datura stramonium]